MPVPVKDKLRAVTRDLGSQTRVAELLGVSRSRVSRWLRAEEPDESNRRKLIGAEFVLGRLLDVYPRDAALDWLQGANGHLGERRPIDLLAAGRITEVLAALEAEEAGSYA